MTLLPGDLALRFTKIFTKEELVQLENVLKQVKRPSTFRINTKKITGEDIKKILIDENIKHEFCNPIQNCVMLYRGEDIKKFYLLDIYKQGCIYMQSISSQMPVKYFSIYKYFNSNIRILDACSAPGGKTSQLSELYPSAYIYAFEPKKTRYEKMCYNFKKLGVHNIQTIHDSIENIGKYITQKEYFDIILVDAPCSGEGKISYHNTKFLKNWSLTYIKKNYFRQKMICDHVVPYLKKGGEMIYSTCTLAPEENEAIIHYLLCKYHTLSLESINLKDNKYITCKKALKSFEKYIFRKEISEHTLRIMPSKYSEGFYIAKMKKI